MPRKPHATEEEYFAREQALKRDKLAREEADRKAKEEREALKKLHWMRCPQCGQELKPLITPQGFEVDHCESCAGMWFDQKALKRLNKAVEGSKNPISSLLSRFRSSEKREDGAGVDKGKAGKK
ncbi:MAG: zf-TFIIB domain-containing protein [Myxococcales bacterium]|jgi:Zn-finger nucleic acid-binding protein|nr:zf-TFIIB domain-containing protein [Myxococcales bacterium]